MNRTNLIRLSGLATMVGSVVFALVLVLRPWLNSMLAEAVTLPMFFLLLGVVSLALVAIVGLLRETRQGWLEIVACGVSLVGVVLVFMGVLLGFAGIFVIYVGVLVATGGLVVLATLTTGTNTLPWWGRVALMVGGPSFILVRYLYHPLEDSLMGVPCWWWALPCFEQQDESLCSPHSYGERSRRQEAMRATSLMGFIVFGALGFGTGAALAGALLGMVGLPLTGAVGGQRWGSERSRSVAWWWEKRPTERPDGHAPTCRCGVCTFVSLDERPAPKMLPNPETGRMED